MKEENFVLSGEIESVKFSKQVTLNAGEQNIVEFDPAEYPQLIFRNLVSGGPTDMGRQELYNLKLSVTEEENVVSDTKNVRFGIREMTYDFTVDYQQARQNVRVNLNPSESMEENG